MKQNCLSQSSYVTKTSYDVILVYWLKLLRFWKMISQNLKIGKHPVTLATSNFFGVMWDET